MLIEDRRVGDLVNTLDNGPQRLVWIGTREVSGAELLVHANLRPVRIQKGVLGNRRRLLVSRQHAMLMGEDHLARAIHLSKSMRGVGLMNALPGVTYIHLMFEATRSSSPRASPAKASIPAPRRWT